MTAEESLTPAAPAGVPNPTAGMTTKVVKGSLWTLAGQVAPLLVSLITTPFVIRMLGAESYGVLVLVSLIPGYLGFADFGMGLASTKFASEAYAEGDPAREARIVRTAALISLCSSLPVAVLMFAASPLIINIFKVPDAVRGDASLALKFTAATLVLTFLNSIFNTSQLTRLRMDLNTFVNAGFRALGLLLLPFAVYVRGVVGAAFVLMLASLLALISHLFISGRLNRSLFEFSIERTAIKPLFKFGVSVVGAGIAAVLLVNTEKGVLAATVSAAALAHYSVAFTLASMMTLFSSSMIQSLMPAFSQLQSSEARPYLELLYSRGIRLNLIWLVPALVFLALIARPFFGIWAGQEFADASTLPFYVLLIGVAFNMLAYLPYTALMASGRSDISAKLYWIELIVYVLIVWELASRYGAVGAAIAWSLRVVADAFIQFALAKRFGGVRYVHRGLLKFVAASAVMLLPVPIGIYLGLFNIATVAAVLICLSIYTVIVFKTTLEDEELSWISHRITGRLLRSRS